MTPLPKCGEFVRVMTDGGLINGFITSVKDKDIPLTETTDGRVMTLRVRDEAQVSLPGNISHTIPAQSWEWKPECGGWVGTPSSVATRH